LPCSPPNAGISASAVNVAVGRPVPILGWSTISSSSPFAARNAEARPLAMLICNPEISKTQVGVSTSCWVPVGSSTRMVCTGWSGTSLAVVSWLAYSTSSISTEAFR
jgi:hypothetical protein